MKRFYTAALGVLAGTAVVFSATGASADGPSTAPFRWTGFYIGAHAGVGESDLDWVYNGFSPSSHTGGGALAGGQAGFNWQAGTIVVGVEADGSWTSITGGAPCPDPNYTCAHDVNWLASVRGRIGTTAVSPGALLYATGGWGWADIDYSATKPGGPNFAFSHTHSGIAAGGGLELAATANMTLRFEYVGYFLRGVVSPSFALSNGFSADLDPTIHTVKMGVNFKF
jgi:outer membrane immunogenic protein